MSPDATVAPDMGSWYPFPEASSLCNGQVAFMSVVYGYVLYQASNMIGEGAEMLLLVRQFASVVGSIVIPILGAVPDGMMVLFSGIGPNAQKEIRVGVGTLAGSTVMLLTLPWFISVFAGRVSIKDGKPTYKRPKGATCEVWDKLSPPGSMSLFETGVSFGGEVRENAKVMLLTLIGYLIIQFPTLTVDRLPILYGESMQERAQDLRNEGSFENPWARVGFIFCFIAFCAYLHREWSGSQTSAGWLDDQIAEVNVHAIRERRLTLRGVLANFRDKRWASISKQSDFDEVLLQKDSISELRRMCKVLAPFFAQYDLNSDNQIDFDEFRMILKDVNESLTKEAQYAMFQAADTDKSGSISFEEFIACLMSFAMENDVVGRNERRTTVCVSKYIRSTEVEDEDDNDDVGDDEEGDEEEDFPPDLADLDPEEQQRRVRARAFGRMACGTGLVLIFTDPMVELLGVMGDRLNMSPFYVSFVLAPLTSNASELVAAYALAKKRTEKSMTNSLLSLLGAAIMNNTFCLGIFLAVMWANELAWEFTAETVSIMTIEVLIGATVFCKPTQRLADAFVILSYYPIALGIVWFLENVAHFD